MNPEQRAAVDATGEVFVSAGAGTGKTSVLVERFVGAVCEQGLDVESVLVITYTRKAAGELRARIRAALHARGRHDLARKLDGAWISTIHGFCSRLLRAHPFAVGIDPRFRELDDEHGAVIRGEAFERALAGFCSTRDSERLRLLATYGAQGLRRMLTGVYETLRSAGRDVQLELGEQAGIPERLADLHAAAQALAADPDVTDKQLAAANAALGAQGEPRAAARSLASRRDRRPHRRLPRARDRLNQAAFDELAARDSELLQELLDLFAAEYAAAKARESALDFEDLQLYARDLLRDHAEVREAEQLRFRAIMVDEFQDTNRLQCDIVDLLRGRGRVRQTCSSSATSSSRSTASGTPTSRSSASAGSAPRCGCRCRGTTARGPRCSPPSTISSARSSATATSRSRPPASSPIRCSAIRSSCSSATSAATGRRGRAGATARLGRSRAACASSSTTASRRPARSCCSSPRAPTPSATRRRCGRRTCRPTAPPAAGTSASSRSSTCSRTCACCTTATTTRRSSRCSRRRSSASRTTASCTSARHAGKRPLFTGVERSLPEPLSENDERLVRAFRQRYERLAAASARLSLERLCEEIVSAHDYDLAVLAQWDGRRRYANLRKLMRLARSYEDLRGPDIEGFVGFIRDQQAVGASQLEAVSEEEGADAVRLLTIHAAKGLEFKVVIVADAGRDTGGVQSSDEILVRPDGTFGFRVIDPKSGKKRGVFSYEEVREAEKQEDTAERLRLYYVAMTRAIDRLIVSGAIDPDRQQDRDTPIGWVLARLGLDGELESGELERGDARFVLGVDRWAPRPRRRGAGARRGRGGPARAVRRAADGACAARVPAAGAPAAAGAAAAPGAPALVLGARAVRALLLPLLHRADRGPARGARRPMPGRARPQGDRGRRRGASPARARRSQRAPAAADSEIVRTWYPASTDEELARIDGFVASYCESELAARIATLDGAEPERPFAFEHDGVLLHGRLDVLWRKGRRALVLDYKTNTLAEGTPEEIVEADYRLQRLVYALACFRAGADEVEVVYHFLERPDAVVSTSSTGSSCPCSRRSSGRDPPDRRRRVRADAERVHLLRLSGARSGVRRAEPAPVARAAGRGRMTESPSPGFEPRWPAAVAVLVAAALYLTLPDALVLGPPWVKYLVPALELARPHPACGHGTPPPRQRIRPASQDSR